jgi:hypothetical protein
MSEYELPPSPLQEWADLRQAVEWIAFGLKPIPIAYDEAERGKVQNIQTSEKAEIIHAKKWLFNFLYENKIIAKGQLEDAKLWNKDKLIEIPNNQWRFNQIKWNQSKLVALDDEVTYINIIFVTDELMKIFPYPFLKRKSNLLPTRDGYISAYMQLMEVAIKEFNITNENQVSSKVLTDWFLQKLKKLPDERYVSDHKAKLLATFVRQPSSQKGGLIKNSEL